MLQSVYLVSEDNGFIEVCVVLDGIIERNVEMELTTDNGTATGIKLLKTDLLILIVPNNLDSSDYTSVVSFPLIFTPSDPIGVLMCANITIILDSVVENTESFLVVLSSSDPAVVLTQSTATATVIILDNSSK